MTGSRQASRPVSRRGVLAGGGVVLVVAIASFWVALAPDAVVSPGATIGLPLEVGESGYVGYYPLSERDLVIESVEPVTLNGLDVAVWMCDPVPGEDPLGSARAADLPEFCRSVEPFEPGTTIAGHSRDHRAVGPYLLVEVTPTEEVPQGLCGLDMTYRLADGWRTGRHREGGSYRVVVNEDGDVAWDDDEELLSACPTW